MSPELNDNYKILFDELTSFEQEISPRDFPSPGEAWFTSIEGHLPVLLSAPHACLHMREGAEKMAEEYTAALSRYVADVTGCHALFAACKSDEDPNWLPKGEYKSALLSLIHI